ncbi:MAG: hypothetical protein DRG27_04645 [Deltaproteobacteria bacterium]|nr:MAG: hypothetical protein DRG27_04645 [Deltaproteobacteria bacterium]
MRWKVYHVGRNSLEIKEEELVEEAPLYLSINGALQRELLRTPFSLKEDKALIIGFCFTEGIIESKDEIVYIRINIKEAEIETRKNKRLSISSSISIADKDRNVSVEDLLNCMKVMESQQKLRLKTRASHAAMLFSYDLTPLYISEDVGRHNALDKVIGKALIDENLKDIFMATLSSRISFEMAKKASKAGIKVLMGISRPTSMAVLFAEKEGISIISLGKDNEIMVFSGEKRIKECQKGIPLN